MGSCCSCAQNGLRRDARILCEEQRNKYKKHVRFISLAATIHICVFGDPCSGCVEKGTGRGSRAFRELEREREHVRPAQMGSVRNYEFPVPVLFRPFCGLVYQYWMPNMNGRTRCACAPRASAQLSPDHNVITIK